MFHRLTEGRQRGGSVGLASYAWDDRLHNYVDLSSGRMVKRQLINDLMCTVTDGSERRMGLLGKLLANGDLTGRQFYELMVREVRLATNVATALSRGGWQNVSPADWGRNGWLCRQEYARLVQFVAEAAAGELSAAQMIERAKLYANTAFGRYWELEQEVAQRRGATEMRTIPVGDDRVCPVCIAEAARGWQPIGSRHVPLHPGCRCSEEHR